MESQSTFKLDSIDKIILEQMMGGSKKSIQSIADFVGISAPAVHQRIKKLEQAEIISSRTYLNFKKLGYDTSAFIGVLIDKSSDYNEIIEEMVKIPEITETYYTTGNYPLLIKIVCKDNTHLLNLLKREIPNIKGIVRLETFIALEQGINRQVKVS